MGLKFSSQIDAEIKKFGALGSQAVTATAKGAWKVAVAANDAHVQTGAMRYNWKLSTKRRGAYVPQRVNRPRPSAPNFKFRIRFDKRVYLYNNMPYASIAENLNPGGMMKKAEMFFESDLSRRFRALRGRKL